MQCGVHNERLPLGLPAGLHPAGCGTSSLCVSSQMAGSGPLLYRSAVRGAVCGAIRRVILHATPANKRCLHTLRGACSEQRRWVCLPPSPPPRSVCVWAASAGRSRAGQGLAGGVHPHPTPPQPSLPCPTTAPRHHYEVHRYARHSNVITL